MPRHTCNSNSRRSIWFTLALLACICFLPFISSVPLTTDVQVGVVWPFIYGLDEIRIPLEMAMSDIRYANILPTGIALSLLFRDSNDSQTENVAAMMDLYTQFNTLTPIRMQAVIGERSIDNTVPVGLLSTALSIPLFNTKVTSPTLNDRTSYTYTLRTSVNDNFLGAAILQAMAQFNWLRFAIIHSDDDVGRGLLDYMIKNPLPDADISVFSIPSNSSLANPVIEKALDSILSSDIRIILLHGSQIENVLGLAQGYGLLDGIHTWLGTHWCLDETIAALGAYDNPLLGTTCFAPAEPRNAEYNDWKTRLRTFNTTSTYYLSATEEQFLDAAYAYDSLFAIAYGISEFHVSSDALTGANLYKYYGNVSFDGITDRVTYNTTTGDRNPQVDILNYNPVTGSYLIKGSYDPSTATLDMDPSVFLWSSGTSYIPKDRPQVYLDDDPLPSATDARIIVLGYVISVLGAWTTLILLEQAISLRQTQQNKEAFIWVAASSFAMGTAGIFGLHYIAFASVTLDTVPIYYKALNFIFCSIIAVVTSFVSLALCITDIRKREKYAHEDSSEITDTSSLSKTRTASIAESGNKTSKVGSSNSSNKSSKRARRTIINKFRSILTSISVRLIAGGLLMAIGIVFTQVLGLYGCVGNYRFELDWNYIVGSIFFSWGLCLIPLLMFFHLTKSSIRFVGAFIMGGVILGSHLISMKGLSYFYILNSTDASYFTYDALEGTTIFAIVLAAICAFICFILMAVNVAKLKISRNTLDRVLVSVQTQMVKLENQIEDERKEKVKLQEQMEFSRKTIEIINLCRPLYRSYAMALALADCDATIANAFLNSSLYENLAQKSKTAAQKSRNESSTDKSEKSKAAGVASVTKQPKPSESKKQSIQVGEKSILSDPNAVNDNANTNITTLDGEKSPNQLVSPSERPSTVTVSTMVAKVPARRSESEFNFIHCKKNEKTILRYLNEFAPILSLENTALQARLLADIKLVHLLSHPATFELLKDALNKQFTPENLTLYCDIQRYRLIENQSVRKIIAEEIFTLFIANSAKYEVNISSFMKDSIEKRMQSEKYSADLFDEVEKEILRLITTNNWDLFIASPQFRMAALILSHVTMNKSNGNQAVQGANGANLANLASAGIVAPYGTMVASKRGNEVSKISTSKQ